MAKVRANGGQYVRVVKSMTRSSVWIGSTKEVKILWVTLLCMADLDGNVWASIPGLAKEAELSIEETQVSLRHLMSPDQFSRTKDLEGRRLVEIPGGWSIVTYAKHRDMQTTTQRDWASRKRAERDPEGVGQVVGTPRIPDLPLYNVDETGKCLETILEIDDVSQCPRTSAKSEIPTGTGDGSGSALLSDPEREDLTGNRARQKPTEPAPALPALTPVQTTSPAAETSDAQTQPPPEDPPKGEVLHALAKAYADGIAAGAGAPWTLPDANREAQVVRNAVALHAPSLRGEKLLAWVQRSAEIYRRALAEDWKYQRNFRPSKWTEWLNAGGDKAPTKKVIGNPDIPRQSGGEKDWTKIAKKVVR